VSEPNVLDASAVLCLIRAELGAAAVQAALPSARISAVNLAEVVAKMADLGMDGPLIAQVLDPLDLTVIPFGADQARASGLMRPATRSLGLSLGDRACLALAAQLGVPALTTDQAWSGVDVGAKVVVVRRPA
jgi:PIN domain nuclease of toxin-antitoxin system